MMEEEELRVPKIIQMQREWEGRPKPLGPRPTWDISVAETHYGVFGFTGKWWWQKLALRMGLHTGVFRNPEFWGWTRCRG